MTLSWVSITLRSEKGVMFVMFLALDLTLFAAVGNGALINQCGGALTTEQAPSARLI